ncbi:MAG: hypothetical protein R2780_13480 [Crocinitomicaceae bacterium]|nr:hypothetical protein [Crocinitomicaceae bacterium]
MNMKNWMLSLVLLSSTFPAISCSWWPSGDEIRFSLFSSSLADGDDISPLYYSVHFFNDYKVDEYTGPAENLQEWYNYFGGAYDIATIDQFIYRGRDKNQDFSNNKLFLDMRGGKYLDVAKYLVFAHTVEGMLEVDYWSDKEMDLEGLRNILPQAESEMQKATDPYLKLRYAYQIVVISYYTGDYAAVANYHKNHVMKSNQESVLKYWSMLYYANTLSDSDERLYLLSKVFDNSKSKARFIYQAYPSDPAAVKGVLKKCASNEEKGAVLSIVAFKNPGRAIDQIKEIADLNANSELLDILLIREINKMEDWYFTDYYTGFGSGIYSGCWECDAFEFVRDKNFQSDKEYLQKVIDVTEQIAEKGGVKNRGLWFTSLAYMNYMLNKGDRTDLFLRLADKHADTDEIRGQIAITRLLHLVKFSDKWDEKFQKELTMAINKVDRYGDHIYRFDHLRSQIMLAVSRKFMYEENLVLAALFEAQVKGGVIETYGWGSEESSGYQAFDLLNENATSADLDKLFELWNKKDKTPLEEELFKELEPYKWRLTDLWGTAYFREDDLGKALKIYETIPDSVWRVEDWRFHYYYAGELDNDPFESNMFGRSYGEAAEETYTKPEFIKEIIRLKTELDGPMVKEKAYYALLLGNAYYNMSYNGNSYYYTEYSWSSYEGEYPRKRDYYFNSSRALAYYEMAETYAPNDAYAAFAYRMQLKCKRDAINYEQEKVDYDKRNYSQIEKEWQIFAEKYPKHAGKLTNCDHFAYYSNAWREG